ncbi:hypothetical protein DMUE_2205 [Dictyocoela muelleri]|nr:hypothetical protein DMUE_2205 [Dictyocoela muelleri]
MGGTISSLIKNLFIGLNLPCYLRLKISPYEMIYQHSIFDICKRNLRKKIKNIKIEESQDAKIINTKLNKKRIKQKYKIVELVFKKTHYPDEILDKWSGPFKVIKIINDDTFLIDEVNKTNRANVKNIKPFGG